MTYAADVAAPRPLLGRRAAFGALVETVTSLSHQIHHAWVVDAPESAVICELTASVEVAMARG